MSMKVYILTASPRHDVNEWVIGVFSSLRRAQDAADAEEPNNWNTYQITPHELDAPWSDDEWQTYEPVRHAKKDE